MGGSPPRSQPLLGHLLRPPHRRGQPPALTLPHRSLHRRAQSLLPPAVQDNFYQFLSIFIIIFTSSLAQHQPPFQTPVLPRALTPVPLRTRSPQSTAKGRAGCDPTCRGCAEDTEQRHGVQSSCHRRGAVLRAVLSPPCLCLPRAPLGIPSEVLSKLAFGDAGSAAMQSTRVESSPDGSDACLTPGCCTDRAGSSLTLQRSPANLVCPLRAVPPAP